VSGGHGAVRMCGSVSHAAAAAAAAAAAVDDQQQQYLPFIIE